MEKIKIKPRPNTNFMVVCCRPELKGKSFHDIRAHHRRKGAWNAGFHFTVVNDELVEGIPMDLPADVVYPNYKEAVVFVLPKAKASNKDKELIAQAAHTVGVNVIKYNNRVDE